MQLYTCTCTISGSASTRAMTSPNLRSDCVILTFMQDYNRAHNYALKCITSSMYGLYTCTCVCTCTSSLWIHDNTVKHALMRWVAEFLIHPGTCMLAMQTLVTANLFGELVKGGPCFSPHLGLEGLVPPHDVLQGGWAEEVLLTQTKLLPLHFLEQIYSKMVHVSLHIHTCNVCLIMTYMLYTNVHVYVWAPTHITWIKIF